MKPKSAYAPWQFDPHTLTKAEADNPYGVLQAFFDYANLPERKAMLWSWLSVAMTGCYPEGQENRQREEILDLYKHIEKLVDAAHVLYTARQPGA